MTNIHNIAVIAGDGVGKEVVPEGIQVMEAALPGLHFELFGWDSDQSPTLLPYSNAGGKRC